MPGKDYAPTRATATRLIKKYGQPAKIVRYTVLSGPEYDPEYKAQEHACTVAEPEPYETREIDGSLVQATDRRFEMAADAEVIPQVDDRLRVDGAEYDIMAVQPLAPGGVVLKWTVQARR